MSDIDFSGERVIPGRVDAGLWNQHLARYHWAATLAPGRNLLDYACGTGYGSAILAEAGAQRVIGLDRSIDAISHARAAYRLPRLHFLAGDCLAAPLADHLFDVVVAFEIIEHVEPTLRFLDEIRRLMTPDATLVLSTPNQKTYGEARSGIANPFHVREFHREELVELLRERFQVVRLLGQWTTEVEQFAPLDSSVAAATWLAADTAAPIRDRDEVEFYLAVCGSVHSSEVPSARSFFVTGTDQLAAARRRIVQLQEEVTEKSSWARGLDEQIEAYERTILSLRDELARKRSAVSEGDASTFRRPDAARWSRIAAARLRDIAREAGAEDEARRWAAVLGRRAAAYAARAVELSTDERPLPTEPTTPQAGDQSGKLLPTAPEARLLFVQSAGTESAVKAVQTLLRVYGSTVELTVLTHHPAAAPPVKHLPASSTVVTGRSWWDLIVLRWSLRRKRFTGVAVLWTNEPGYRRLKLLGWSYALRRLLVFNENADAFLLSPAPLLRHCIWRLRTRRGLLHKLRTACRVLRREGVGSLWRHTRRALAEPRRPRVSFAKARLRRRVRPHVFPKAAEPALSIVIPARNQWIYTYNCLLSILRTAGDIDYDIVVVDNASTDRTPGILARQANLRVLRLDTNHGFVEACNKGAAIARGELLLFLNNDTLVRDGCLQEMIATFGRADCGIVGPKMVYPDGLLQEAGGIVWQDGTAWNYGKFADASAPKFNYLREVDYVSGAALMIRREIFAQLGGFDSRYAPGYWEDTDLGFSIRPLGLRVFYQPRAELVHFEGATSGRSVKRGMKRFQEVNAAKFREKWKESLCEQIPHDPDLTFLARDRNRRRMVLVVDHHVPTPDKDAGSYVMYRVLVGLLQMGFRVVLWPDNLYALPNYTEALQQQGIEVLYGALDFDSYIARSGSFFDLGFVHRSSMADKYLLRMRAQIPEVVYLCADLEHLREQRRATACGEREPADAAKDETAERYWQRELRVVSLSDRVAVHSPVERGLLAEQFPDKPIEVLPLPVRDAARPESPSFDERRDLLFVGSSHPPNVDAVAFWAREIGPRLADLLPGVALDVVGEVARSLPDLQRRQLHELRLHGFVADLTELYSGRRVFVAPLRYGAGVKGKILEAMSSGLPVVTTSAGAEGIEIEHGIHALVADDAESFARAVRDLHEDAALWSRIKRQASELLARDYGEEVFRRRLQRLVLGDSPPETPRWRRTLQAVEERSSRPVALGPAR